MSGDWDRVTELFGAARLLDEPARSAFLDAACSADRELRAQLDALLSADAGNDGFLDALPPVSPEIFQTFEGLLRPGTVLKGRYVVDERFAAGGHALVYVATDRVLSRRVIIKVLRAGRLRSSSLKLRFDQEMHALSRIDHPGVVGILDVGELEDGSPFLAIQFVNGESLRTLLSEGPIEPVRVAHILRGIGAALRAAHAGGIAHRDLKPENVMVQRLADGTEAVKLIDFGLAKIDRAEFGGDVTTVMIEGTVRYMAPEQFEGRNSPASDMYSFGLLACELLCGHPNPRALPKNTDRRILRLIESSVAFAPEERPRDVKAWSEDLSEALLRTRAGRRLLVPMLLLSLGAGIATIATLAAIRPDDGTSERIIEKVGAFDPVTEGFEIHAEVSGTVVRTEDNTGFIGWSVASSSPGSGYYFRRLTEAQKRGALARGWTLRTVMKTNAGGGFVVVDLGAAGRRFDINVLREEGADVVRLNTQIVPVLQGLDLRIARAADVFYQCELRFDPGLQTADLWVNGEKRLAGYRGHTQFQEDKGLMFGAAPYKGARGMASFQSVRFEINP